MKRIVNCGELSVEITLLGLPYIVKAASETWPNTHVKVNSTLCTVFSTKALQRDGPHAKGEFRALRQ